MNCIIDFYKWLNRERIFPWSDECKPCDFRYVNVRDNRNPDHHMLSHTNRNRVIEVQTNTIMERFPKTQTKAPYQKLKPMFGNDKVIFEKELKRRIDGSGDIKALMCKFAMATGVRVEELVTFPDSVIISPVLDKTPVSISPANGCMTKFGKQREIEIPRDLMQELYEYRLSDERKKLLGKVGIKLDKENKYQQVCESDKTHGRLFVNRDGKPFKKNTIQSYLSDIRSGIRETYPNWYYRIHDLRSTFATHWLLEQHQKRGVAFDYLLDELSTIMGHESTKDTLKYTSFMNKRSVFIKHSANKNEKAAQVLRGNNG